MLIVVFQTFIALALTLTNASLQAYALAQINKADLKDSDLKVSEVKNMLLGSVVSQFLTAILLMVIFVLLFVYREKYQKHIGWMIYAGLSISTFLMFVGGVIGATAATRLQCYKKLPHVYEAWRMSMLTGVMGILGTMMIMFVQAFLKRHEIKEQATKLLATRPVAPTQMTQLPSFTSSMDS